MDYKKSKAPTNTVTHNLMDFCEGTNNIYESVVIMSKRANQIGVQMKEDLSKKLKEFASANDNLEETFENREQIEISRYYERLPKPTLIAADEYLKKNIYFRNCNASNGMKPTSSCRPLSSKWVSMCPTLLLWSSRMLNASV